MIRTIVDAALDNRLIVLTVAALVFAAGAVAFKDLPVEAYPDVANTWVQVITQWPGRAPEEVEQQITIPIEIQVNGLPSLLHVRSASLAGLSVVNLIFDDGSDNDWDRQKVLERLANVTLPANVTAQIGPDFSPIGSIYWYTIVSTNPAYDVMELKSLQDWVVSKYLRSVPDVVDDSSFGGITREYQVRLDPEKLISYGLSLAQAEQQLTNGNANTGGSFIEQGSQQVNVRGVGLVTNVKDLEETVLRTQNGTAVRIKTSQWSRRGRRSVWDRSARRSIELTAWLPMTTTWSRVLCSCARAQAQRPRWPEFTLSSPDSTIRSCPRA